MITIQISRDFSRTLGHRSEEDGQHSGEDFLQKWLKPKYCEARTAGDKLLVDLDGTAGYGTSFLEAAFGGLAREYPIEEVLSTVQFKSDDEPYLPEEIEGYIREARAKK